MVVEGPVKAFLLATHASQSVAICRFSSRHCATRFVKLPPELACTTTIDVASCAACALRNAAASWVSRVTALTLLTTAMRSRVRGSSHAGGNLAPCTGRANTATTGLRACSNTVNTDCSNGEWKPPITTCRALACAMPSPWPRGWLRRGTGGRRRTPSRTHPASRSHPDHG